MMNRTDFTKDTKSMTESSYAEIADHPYYVDKTMLIKEMIDDRPYVTLFTRPHGFGKSLALDMLRTYFGKSQNDTTEYFKGKKIWAFGKKYTDLQGQFPVIMLKFKDTRIDCFEDFLNTIRAMLKEELQRHPELFHSNVLKDYETDLLTYTMEGTMSSVACSRALMELTGILRKHHDRRVIVLIDNYDLPMLKCFDKDCRQQIMSFMRIFLSAGLKGNDDLAFSVLTGIMPIILADDFGGFNNLIAYTILDSNYCEHFGFSEAEVQQLAVNCGIQDRMDQIIKWYGGYHIGDLDCFHPASVIAYLCNHCRPAVYRTIAEDEKILHTLISGEAGRSDDLSLLLDGEEIHEYLDMYSLYPDLIKGRNPLCCYLAASGYLSAVPYGHNYSCYGDPVSLKIPNQETLHLLTGILTDLLPSA